MVHYDFLCFPHHNVLPSLQSVLEVLQQNEPEIAFIEDKAQQIGIEGTSDDINALKNQVQTVKDRAKKLKDDSEKYSQYFGSLLAERGSFNTDLVKTIDFLHQKENQIRSHDQLSMDEESIDAELAKLNQLSNEIYSVLGPAEESLDEQKKRYDENDEGIPLDVKDRMDNYEQLRDQIKVSTTSL